MKYIILIILSFVSCYADAQRLLGGTSQDLKFKGGIYQLANDSVGVPTGGCIFRDFTTGKYRVGPCGSGGTYTAGNGMTLTANAFILGATNMSGPVVFSNTSGRSNWNWNTVDTATFDALHFQIYRNVEVISNGTSAVKFGGLAGAGDAYLQYDNATGEVRQGGVNGTFPTYYASGSEFMRSTFSQQMLVGYTSDNGSGVKFQVNGKIAIAADSAGNAPHALYRGANGQVFEGAIPSASPSTYTVGAIDSLTKSANGLVIAGQKIVPQTADATYPGLVSTTTQSFIGTKNFQGNLPMELTIPTDDDRGYISFWNAGRTSRAFIGLTGPTFPADPDLAGGLTLLGINGSPYTGMINIYPDAGIFIGDHSTWMKDAGSNVTLGGSALARNTFKTDSIDVYTTDISARYTNRTKPDVGWVKQAISDSIAAHGGGGGGTDTLVVFYKGIGIHKIYPGSDTLYDKTISGLNSISITTSSDSTINVKLVNDTAIGTAAGYYYGTSTGGSAGRLGFYALPTANNIYTADGTLTGDRTLSGNNKELRLGTSLSPLSSLQMQATSIILASGIGGDIHFGGPLTYSITSAADLNYTENSDYSIILPVITANRTLTLSSASTNIGKALIIMNRNTSGSFTWSFVGTVKDGAGNTITNLVNGTVYQLFADGTNWIKIN